MIRPTLCKGCGLCAASCRSGAISLQGTASGQVMAMIDAMMQDEESPEKAFAGTTGIG